jgi:outer membrane protein insertion porin family
LKGAVFVDAGNLIGYSGPTDFSSFLGFVNCPPPGSFGRAFPTTQLSCAQVSDPNIIRASVGASLIWDSPMGPIRFDLAIPIRKGEFDQTQLFNFSGGTTF